MKKLILYSALVVALGACKNDSTTKQVDKSNTNTSTSSGDNGTTSSPTNPINNGSSTMQNQSGSWSSVDKTAFMSTCTEKASPNMGESKAKDYCSCMLDKIQTAYPTSSDAVKLTKEQTTQMAKECLNLK